MHLKIKLLKENLAEFYDVRKNHSCDSGFDLYCPRDRSIDNGALGQEIHLGVAIEAVNDNGEPCAFMLAPRGSISKTPLRLSNSIGIVDKSYRGPLMAKVDNLDEFDVACGFVDYQIRRGQRLFQVVAFDGSEITYEIVNELSETVRGSGRYGSTGV